MRGQSRPGAMPIPTFSRDTVSQTKSFFKESISSSSGPGRLALVKLDDKAFFAPIGVEIRDQHRAQSKFCGRA